MTGPYLAVLAAGPQGGTPGLDEVSVVLPRNLAVSGEVPVLLSVDGRAANPVTVRIK